MGSMTNNPQMQIINLMQSKNPQQMALNLLQQQNPQMFGQISQMMSSGMTPNQAMRTLGIDESQLNAMRNQFTNGFNPFR